MGLEHLHLAVPNVFACVHFLIENRVKIGSRFNLGTRAKFAIKKKERKI